MNIKWIGCAPRNFREGRPAGLEVEAIVIHLIDGSQAGADATFLDNNLQLCRSAHYSIGQAGEIHQYVKESDTACHAGKIYQPAWQGLKKMADGSFINPNYYTIGIEHEGRPNDPWSDAMYAASAALLGAISQRFPKLKRLTLDNVVMHRAIRADKSCPGFKAGLGRLIREATLDVIPPQGGPGAVSTVTGVNLRRGQPSRSAPVIRVIPADTLVSVTGWVKGEPVKSINQVIDIWYQTVDNDYFWAGATSQPSPT